MLFRELFWHADSKALPFGRLFFASFPAGIDCKAEEMQQGLHVPGVMNKHAETRIETMLFRQVFLKGNKRVTFSAQPRPLGAAM